jgi:Uma2 family endonuclease
MASATPVRVQTQEKREGYTPFEEWLNSTPDNRITEWVNGEVIEMSPVSDRHEDVVGWLYTILRVFLESTEIGRVRANPYPLKLTQTPRGREPDLMFIAMEHYDRMLPTFVLGPADAVWEIVSPESIGRDRGEKFVEYEAEGIPEYWLIDPERQQLELYHLGEDQRYRSVTPQDGKYPSSVIPGFYIRAEWLWSEPLPPTLTVLREFGVL